jgi:hypothetical protein
MATNVKDRLWQLTTDSFRIYQRALGSIGLRQSESRLSADSQAYWAAPPTDSSKARSHWRDAHSFAANDRWHGIGRKHREMFDRAARTVGRPGPMGRVLEWGCGGGANAVHFLSGGTARKFYWNKRNDWLDAHGLATRSGDNVCGTPTACDLNTQDDPVGGFGTAPK